jgi:hypothetical protein
MKRTIVAIGYGERPTDPPKAEPLVNAPSVALAESSENLAEATPVHCDACDAPLGEADLEQGGSGLYVWARHGEIVYEEPPLCPKCAHAITASALQRWEIEEEEG